MRAAIFDLDGTLLDSMGIWRQIDVDFFAKRRMPMPEDYFVAIRSMHLQQAADYTITRFGLPQTAQEVIAEWREMATHAYATTVELKPFVLDYLQQLQQQGVHLAAATASDPCFIEAAFARLGLAPYFETVVYSHEVSRGKGFPDVYQEAARRLGIAPKDCTVFEDILPAIQGAKMDVFGTVGVYDETSKEDWPAIQQLADQSIVSFESLLTK